MQELNAHLAAHAYDGARVHFIGHLQTNKVKYVVGHVELIHSVSSEKLLLAIDKQAEKLDIVQDILLEVNRLFPRDGPGRGPPGRRPGPYPAPGAHVHPARGGGARAKSAFFRKIKDFSC